MVCAILNLGCRLPRGTRVRMRFHDKVQLGKGNFGPFMEALLQRLEFVLNRKTPERYNEDKEEFDAFEALKEDVKGYLDTLKKVQEDYNTVIEKARGTVDMDEVKKRRKEKYLAYRKKRSAEKDASDKSDDGKENDSEKESENDDAPAQKVVEAEA